MTDNANRPIDRIFARAVEMGFAKPDGSVNLRALAREAEIDHTLLMRARDRDGRLGAETYRALAKALDTTVSDLMGETEAVPSGAALTTAAHCRVHPSPLNYRKHFNPEKQADLDNSVLLRGILLPLLVRRANQPGNRPLEGAAAGDLEIIAGERRWRAARSHIAAGVWPVDWPLPVKLIDPCSDRELLELALTENKDRDDTTPWEEAQAYATLKEMGASATEIAQSAGVVKRTVEKRLKLITDLHPTAQAALAEGGISVEAANILASFARTDDQPDLLAEVMAGRYRTTGDLKAGILAKVIPERRAAFDITLYAGAWMADEETDGRYFADTAEFTRLQLQAVQDKAEHFRTGKRYSWVEIFDTRKGRHFHKSTYKSQPKHPQAGVAIVIGHDLSVTVYTDMVEETILAREAKKALAGPGGSPGGGDPAPEINPVTKAHGGRARNRKTAALQNAIVGQAAMAMRLVILSLIGGARDAVKIRAEHTAADDRAMGHRPRTVIEPFLDRIAAAAKAGFEIDASGPGKKGWEALDEAAIWREMGRMPDDEIATLFSAFVALRVGSWNNGQPDIGDDPVVVEIARSLGLAGAEIKHGLAAQPEDLDGLRKEALLAVASLSGKAHAINRPQTLTAMSAKELKAGLAEVIIGAYVLPSFRFASKAAVTEAFAQAAAPTQVSLEDAIASAKAIKPMPMPPSLDTLRRALAPYSIFAAKAEADSAFPELVGLEDFGRVATGLSATFGITITRDDLMRVGDIGDLAALIDLRTVEKSQAA